MSITPKMLSGSAGVVQDQIQAGVLYCFWSRSRARWGEEVHLGAVVSGWADGTAVELVVMENDNGQDDDEVTVLDASIDGGIVSGSYTIEFEDPDSDEGDEYELYFRVRIEGELISTVDQCPFLLVDMTLPWASE